MDTYRQKHLAELTAEQRSLKLQKDVEFEAETQKIAGAFYLKKRGPGVTPQEAEEFKQASLSLWNDYLAWAKANGLYELITPQRKLDEAEESLNEQVEEVNQLRTQLGQAQVEVKEKTK